MAPPDSSTGVTKPLEYQANAETRQAGDNGLCLFMPRLCLWPRRIPQWRNWRKWQLRSCAPSRTITNLDRSCLVSLSVGDDDTANALRIIGIRNAPATRDLGEPDKLERAEWNSR